MTKILRGAVGIGYLERVRPSRERRYWRRPRPGIRCLRDANHLPRPVEFSGRFGLQLLRGDFPGAAAVRVTDESPQEFGIPSPVTSVDAPRAGLV